MEASGEDRDLKISAVFIARHDSMSHTKIPTSLRYLK